MSRMRSLARVAILPALGAIVLLAAGGCGNGSYSVDPEGGAKLKQARLNAYGPSGTPSGRASNLNSQAAARQRAGQGGNR